MNAWSRLATCGLAGVFIINAAATVGYFVLHWQLHKAQPRASLTVGEKFPFLSGVDVRGEKWEPQDARCRVIRITDDSCSFCNRDKPSYGAILEVASRASCEVIEVAPQAGGLAYEPHPGVVQLKFVDSDVGSVLYPFVTPQTIIVDQNWTVKMTRRGMFDGRSLASAMEALRALAAPLDSQ